MCTERGVIPAGRGGRCPVLSYCGDVGRVDRFVGLSLYSMFSCPCYLHICYLATTVTTLGSGIVGTEVTIIVSLHVGGVLIETVLQRALVRSYSWISRLTFSCWRLFSI